MPQMEVVFFASECFYPVLIKKKNIRWPALSKNCIYLFIKKSL